MKANVGDEVTVKGVVEQHYGNNESVMFVRFRHTYSNLVSACWVSEEDIISAAPKELAVGDKVRWGSGPRAVGTILYIHDLYAWFKYDNGSLSTIPLMELTRA